MVPCVATVADGAPLGFPVVLQVQKRGSFAPGWLAVPLGSVVSGAGVSAAPPSATASNGIANTQTNDSAKANLKKVIFNMQSSLSEAYLRIQNDLGT